MTSVDELREAVIEAAREHRAIGSDPSFKDLAEAVDALDEAEKPDPWQLLREIDMRLDTGTGKYRDDFMPMSGSVGDRELAMSITRALEWREKNG